MVAWLLATSLSQLLWMIGFACLASTELAQDLQILSGFTSGFTNPVRIYVRIYKSYQDLRQDLLSQAGFTVGFTFPGKEFTLISFSCHVLNNDSQTLL